MRHDNDHVGKAAPLLPERWITTAYACSVSSLLFFQSDSFAVKYFMVTVTPWLFIHNDSITNIPLQFGDQIVWLDQ